MATAKKDPMILLYLAINAVMKEVGFVHKGGTIKGGAGYAFVGEADLLRAIRPVMVEHGLMILPISYAVEEHQHTPIVDKWNNAKIDHLITLTATFRMSHVGGGHIDIQSVGIGTDRQDKQANCAMTIALKYALRQAFALETGDDPDRHASGASRDEIDKGIEDQKRDRAVAGAGFKPAEINAYLTSLGQPRYEDMTGGKFGKVLERIKSKDGKAKIREFVEAKNTNSTDRASAAMDG